MFGPVSAVQNYLLNGLDFSGRASRAAFWWPVSLVSALTLFLALRDAWEIFVFGLGAFNLLGSPTLWLIFITAPLSFSVTVRRLHDSGKSSLYLLALGIPMVGWLICLVFLMAPSDRMENRYGPPPGAAGHSGIGGWDHDMTAPRSAAQSADSASRNPYAAYALLAEGAAQDSPETVEERRAAVKDYYRTRVLGQSG